MSVRQLALIALSPLAIAAVPAKKIADRNAGPCYSVVTAYVADSAPLRIHKIISTGVRRFVDSRTLAPPACAPVDRRRADLLHAAVMDQLGKEIARANWVIIESVDSEVVNEHLVRLNRFVAQDIARTTVHVGPDTDLVSLSARQ